MTTKKKKPTESRTPLARGKRAILIEVTDEQKDTLRMAATLDETTLAHFVRHAAMAAARKVIEIGK